MTHEPDSSVRPDPFDGAEPGAPASAVEAERLLIEATDEACGVRKPPTTAQANANLLRDIASAPAPSGIDALRSLENDLASMATIENAATFLDETIPLWIGYAQSALAEIEALRASKPDSFDDRRTRQNAARVNDRVADALDILLARVDATDNCKNQGDLCVKFVHDLCDVWRCR